MMHNDPEIREHVETKGQRMFSAAMYRRLKSITDGWARDERGKAKVAVQSLLWLMGILPVAIGLGWLAGTSFFGSLFLGFLFWVVVVIALMRQHL